MILICVRSPFFYFSQTATILSKERFIRNFNFFKAALYKAHPEQIVLVERKPFHNF